MPGVARDGDGLGAKGPGQIPCARSLLGSVACAIACVVHFGLLPDILRHTPEAAARVDVTPIERLRWWCTYWRSDAVAGPRANPGEPPIEGKGQSVVQAFDGLEHTFRRRIQETGEAKVADIVGQASHLDFAARRSSCRTSTGGQHRSSMNSICHSTGETRVGLVD